jgi:hypothetical protein
MQFIQRLLEVGRDPSGAKVVAGLFCFGDILVSYCQILLARLYLIQKEE